MHNSVLTKCWCPHEMINKFPIYWETTFAVIHHNTNSSGSPNFPTKICFPWFTELTLSAFCLVTRYDMVSGLNLSYSLTDTLNNPVQANFKQISTPEIWISQALARLHRIHSAYPAASWPRIQGKRPSGSCKTNILDLKQNNNDHNKNSDNNNDDDDNNNGDDDGGWWYKL